MKVKTAVVFLLAFSFSANANLIRNASFEDVPDSSGGQGLMPSEWVTVLSSPDTYSIDGSYGLLPSGFGNFTGQTAYDGVRWVAGWSSADEQFGQLLTTPLTAGLTYTFSAHMLQAVRSDLNNPGGYQLYLTSDETGDIAGGQILGSIGNTMDGSGWQLFSTTFVAPADAASLPFLLFVPFGEGDGSAYPGLDAVYLNAIPIPAALWLFAGGLITLIRWRRNPR